MTSLLSELGLSSASWLLLFTAAALIGANKTGIEGIMLLSVPVLAILRRSLRSRTGLSS